MTNARYLYLLILPFTLITLTARSQNDQTASRIQRLCEEIAEHGGVESSNIGFSGLPSGQWNRYEQLLEIASDTDLQTLTNHSSPAVRVYAFYGLMRRNKDLFLENIVRHETDSTLVESQSGCIVTRSPFIVLLQEQAYYEWVYPQKQILTTEWQAYFEQAHIREMERRKALPLLG